MRVTVKLFGSVREAAGATQLEEELPEGSRVSDLQARLARQFPVFERLGSRLATSVNLELVDSQSVLRDGDEVAFLPPVAGGVGACTIAAEVLEESAVRARVAGSDAGAVVSFCGVVRDHARGRAIKHLEYEAYPEMAEREMQKIADRAAERWPGCRVAIAHRIGQLEIGDLAVVVAAAAPHRGEAFDACRFAIDTLKQTVPIWKKEVAVDGEYWVDDHA
ncbi:MAG: molybdenum cofactor biosynthesis protein MoaE [Myxococcota bacterium]